MLQGRVTPVVQLVLALVAVLLAGSALVLAVDNPSIGRTSRGADYTCLAPWDTVLNHADNHPGGEPPPDGDRIEALCEAAGRRRFDQAVLVGAGAVGVAVLAGGLGLGRWIGYRRAVARYRRARTPAGSTSATDDRADGAAR